MSINVPLDLYQVAVLLYFIISGEISVHLVKIKRFSFTSEMISDMIRCTVSLLALDDFSFLYWFKSGCYRHFRFLTPLTSLFLS